MANEETIEVTAQGNGAFEVQVPATDEIVHFTLALAEAPDASGGRLAADEATARATVAFLLERQEAIDLPWRVEVTDVAAAYPDAVDRILALRHP